MKTRGTYEFEVTGGGRLKDGAPNLDKLRLLLLDRKLVRVEDLGPGDPGDFDFGAWHVACHAVAASAVFRLRPGALALLDLEHVPSADLYTAAVTVAARRERVRTFPATSHEGRALLDGAQILGFIEGSSLGRISARDADDPPDRFNLWRRQQFDKPVVSKADGGRVWEHWCTVRDIRPGARVGVSVLGGYLTMLNLCGGVLATAVARGRRRYSHPRQLVAMVKAGLVSVEDAVADLVPKPIPRKLEPRIYLADPVSTLAVAGQLEWSQQGLTYYMFARRIGQWSRTDSVRNDLKTAGLLAPARR